jgi:hypothetical protein
MFRLFDARAAAQRTKLAKFLPADSRFTATFDEVYRREDIKVIRTRARAPPAYAYAERLVCAVRAEYLDWLLIPDRRRPPRIRVLRR